MPKGLKQKLSQYIDAGFPILYINSFENDKIDDMIREIGDRREIVEWNGARGMVDFNTKNPLLSGNATLSSMLNLYMEKEELKRILIVLKDIHSQLENPEIVAKLKIIANLINQGGRCRSYYRFHGCSNSLRAGEIYYDSGDGLPVNGGDSGIDLGIHQRKWLSAASRYTAG